MASRFERIAHEVALPANIPTLAIASSGWMEDTLVLTTRLVATTHHENVTIEPMTLGPGRNTVLDTNLSLVGRKYRYGRPHVFVLRRIMP